MCSAYKQPVQGHVTTTPATTQAHGSSYWDESHEVNVTKGVATSIASSSAAHSEQVMGGAIAIAQYCCMQAVIMIAICKR